MYGKSCTFASCCYEMQVLAIYANFREVFISRQKYYTLHSLENKSNNI